MRAVLGILRYLITLAKEIGDEAAYERHLANRSMRHSAQEWRRFSDARLRRKYEQGKCC